MRTVLLASLLTAACSTPPEPPSQPDPPVEPPPTEATAENARIVPTANPRSVPPDDQGAVANTAEALESIQRLQGDPQGILAAYREGASRAVTLDLAPFGLQAHSVIADIGAGTGALPVRLLAEGVPFGKLYAVETDRRSLDVLEAALEATGLAEAQQVELVHSAPDDVSLPQAEVDRVIVIDTGIGCIPPDGSGYDLPPMRSKRSEGLLRSIRAAVSDQARVHVLRPWNAPPAPPFTCPSDWVIQSFGAADFHLVDDRPQVPPQGPEPEHRAFHLVFAPGPAPG